MFSTKGGKFVDYSEQELLVNLRDARDQKYKCWNFMDPLGSVRVQMTGSHTGKMMPLIICDLNTGAVCVQHMLGVRAEHIFMALQCLQYRYGMEVIMAFTDAGSQLRKSLGKKYEVGWDN